MEREWRRQLHAQEYLGNKERIRDKGNPCHVDIKITMMYAHLEQRDVSLQARDVINKINTQVGKPELKIV